MSFVLLLFKNLPGLVTLFNDVWFRIQLGMTGFERNAAENSLFGLVRSFFVENPNEPNPVTKWELIKSEAEIVAALNTFFDNLK